MTLYLCFVMFSGFEWEIVAFAPKNRREERIMLSQYECWETDKVYF